MLAITEKELGHALFYAIKLQDYDHVEYLLTLDPPLATSYFIAQDNIAYTPNFIVGKVAEIIKKYGLAHNKTQQVLRILQFFLQAKCDWRCHCSPKNSHYCAISQILKHLPLDRHKDLLCEQNLLLLKLLYHGATYRNLHNTKQSVWVGITELNAYIEARKEEVIQLVKMNRHTKPCSANRHLRCAKNNKT